MTNPTMLNIAATIAIAIVVVLAVVFVVVLGLAVWVDSRGHEELERKVAVLESTVGKLSDTVAQLKTAIPPPPPPKHIPTAAELYPEPY